MKPHVPQSVYRSIYQKHYQEVFSYKQDLTAAQQDFSSRNSPILKKYIKAALVLLLIFCTMSIYGQVAVKATKGNTNGNYNSLSAAFAAINSGQHKDTIHVSITANITEPLWVTPLYKSGSDSSEKSDYTYVSIRPSGGNFTISSPSSPSTLRGLVEFAGARNVLLDGDDPATAGDHNLTIQVDTSSSSVTAAIRIASKGATGGTNHITIRNCKIVGSRASSLSTTLNYGIKFSDWPNFAWSSFGNTNTTLDNNLIYRAFQGIHAAGLSNTSPNTGLLIRNNTIGSAKPGEEIGGVGIYLKHTNQHSSTANPDEEAAVVSGNEIIAGNYTRGLQTSVFGIHIENRNKGLLLENNNIHNIAQGTAGFSACGIYLNSSDNNNNIRIVNNFIRDVTGGYNDNPSLNSVNKICGIEIESADAGLFINHNTIVLNKPNVRGTATAENPFSSCIDLGFYHDTKVLSQVMSNILVNNQGDSSSNAFCISAQYPVNFDPATVDYNCYFKRGKGKIGIYGTTDFSMASTDLASWQIKTKKDKNSIHTDPTPTFVSATDLHLKKGITTPLAGGGANSNITKVYTDIDQQTRLSPFGDTTTTDIGAHEFSCMQPQQSDAGIAGKDTICKDQDFTYFINVPGADHYQWIIPASWSGTSTTDSIHLRIESSGTLKVVLPGVCDTYALDVYVPQLNAAIREEQQTIRTIETGYDSWQWYYNDTALYSATEPELDISKNGTYSVIVTRYGCKDTAHYTVSGFTGIASHNKASSCFIYPNPAQDYIFIKSTLPVQVKISGMDGRILRTITNATSIDLTALPKGILLLQIYDLEGRWIKTEKTTRF